MRPVNLLPPKHRPRQRSGRGGPAHAILGVLGVLLLAALLYVHTANQVTSRTNDAAELRDETRGLEARAAGLRPYAAFAKLKETRLTAVRGLAAVRFDWERLVRETARVLPSEAWLRGVEATLAPATAASGAAGASTGDSSAAGGSSRELAGPGMKLSGCARAQRDVARTMVRLRRVHFTADVELVKSSRPESTGGAAGAGGGPSGCGETRGLPNLEFAVNVTFAPGTLASGLDAPGRVPASLGGGG